MKYIIYKDSYGLNENVAIIFNIVTQHREMYTAINKPGIVLISAGKITLTHIKEEADILNMFKIDHGSSTLDIKFDENRHKIDILILEMQFHI